MRLRGRRGAQTALALESARRYRERAEAKLQQATQERLAAPGRTWYVPTPLDDIPAEGPQHTLDTLIEQHTAMYPDPRTRQWVERRLRRWWEANGGSNETDR